MNLYSGTITGGRENVIIFNRDYYIVCDTENEAYEYLHGKVIGGVNTIIKFHAFILYEGISPKLVKKIKEVGIKISEPQSL